MLKIENNLGFSSKLFSDFKKKLTQLSDSVKSSVTNWKSDGVCAAYRFARSTLTLLSLFEMKK